MKLEVSRYMFEKSSNIKFHKNPSSGSRDVPCGWTDGHDEANSRFSQFREKSKKTQVKFRYTAVTIKLRIFTISGLKVLQFCLLVYNGAEVNLPASEKNTN
jgi:hypothetical protein